MSHLDNLKPGPIKVMQSQAGYYLGRSCINPESNCEMPFSRESGYFRTNEKADKALNKLNSDFKKQK